MARLRRTSTRLAIALVCASVLGRVYAAQAPRGLRVDGVEGNRHVVSVTPEFCWESGAEQVNWQVQVDDDGGFRSGAGGGVWFWDSGQASKGSMGKSRCAVMRQFVRSGMPTQALDRRVEGIHWRVRVQGVGGEWSGWSVGEFRMNQPPQMPEAVSVEEQSGGGGRLQRREVGEPGNWYYVSVGGSDAGAGTQREPFGTLGQAMRVLRAGDTLWVRGGVYEENVEVSTAGGYASGEAGRPIVVRSYPGELVQLRALSAGSRTALQVGPGKVEHWRFEGLSIGGPSALRGVHVVGASRVSLSGCRWEGSTREESAGVVVSGGSREVEVRGCRFEESKGDQLEVSGSGPVRVEGNEFRGFRGRQAVQVRGATGEVVLEGNRFEDGSPSVAAVTIGLGAVGAGVYGNVFAGLRGDVDGGSGVMVYRGGGVRVEGNVFYEVTGSGIRLGEMSQYGRYRGNVMMGCGVGVEFRGGVVFGSSTRGSVLDDNVFHANGVDVLMDEREAEQLLHAPKGNCFGGRGSACDPMFEDAEGGDFGMRVGGVGRRASEEPVVVRDATPRMRWSLRDLDNEVGGGGSGDTQARYQVQVDRRRTFDGEGGWPMLDTGVVESVEQSWTVPAEASLGDGEYYARVRQWDGHEEMGGAWSKPVRFRVEGVGTGPGVWGMEPADGAQAVEPAVRVAAQLTGVEAAGTARMWVNGIEVRPRVEPQASGLKVMYEPPRPFAAGSTVSVRVQVQRQAGTAPLQQSWAFAVRGQSPAPPPNVRIAR